MNRDIVIYNKKNKEIIAILSNIDNIDNFEDIILNKQYDYDKVNNNEPYIKGYENKIYYIRGQNGNIINFEDYKRLKKY